MCMFTKAASTYARANLYGMASLSTQRGLWGIAILRVVQSVGHSSLALGSPQEVTFFQQDIQSLRYWSSIWPIRPGSWSFV